MTTARLPARILSCLLALSMGVASAAPAAAPRLWKATRTAPEHGTTVLYVLAATSVGLPVEFDGYYTRAVLPALRASSTLSVEGIGDGDEAPPDFDANPGCDLRQIDEAGIARLNDVRQRILTLTLQADMARRDALDVKALAKAPDPDTQARSWARLIEMSDEFTLLQFARDQAAALAAGHKTEGAEAPRGSVAAALIRARPDIAVHDIDDRTGMMRAYCASGPRRTMLLQDVVDNAAEPAARAIPRLTHDLDALLRNRAPAAGGPFARLAPLDAGLVCARDRGWVRRMNALADGGTHFYVVPVRNLFAARHDAADCGGLLADLEQAGYTVAPVK